MTLRTDRRTVLKGLFQQALLLGVPAPAAMATGFSRPACKPKLNDETSFLKVMEATDVVDVHCHIFNAADIPAYQFLEKVVALHMAYKKYVEGQDQNSIYQLRQGEWRTFYAHHRNMFNTTWTLLKNNRHLIRNLPVDRLYLTPAFEQENALLDELLSHGGTDRQEIEHRLLGAVHARRDQWSNVNYLRQWLRLAGQEWRGAENAEEEELAAAANVMHQLNADPAYPIDALNNYLSFVLAMARTRTENFLHLKSYYRIEGLEGVQPIKLFTPALVDFDFWLDSPETARIHDPRGICAAELARAEAAGTETAACVPGDEDGCVTDAPAGAPPSLLEACLLGNTAFQPEVRSYARRTTLKEQMTLMGKLSKLYPGECHAFFPFCPWRQVHFDKAADKGSLENPLALIEEAIDHHGFVGVKLYPPMGFRPWNNKKAENFYESERQGVKFHMFPDHLYDPKRFPYIQHRCSDEDEWKWKYHVSGTFGGWLDEALEELYSLCERRNIPIMAHSGASNFCGGYDFLQTVNGARSIQHNFYSEKGAPNYWRSVLEHYPRLRLNLAHAGFAEAYWHERIACLLDTYEHAYCDLSYFEYILSSDGDDPCDDAKTFTTKIAEHIAKRPSIAGKLMYGSDWFMMLRENHNARYLDNFARLAHIMQDEQSADFGGVSVRWFFKNIMAANAIRFLGLDDRMGDSNYTRLNHQFGRWYANDAAGLDRASQALNRLCVQAESHEAWGDPMPRACRRADESIAKAPQPLQSRPSCDNRSAAGTR